MARNGDDFKREDEEQASAPISVTDAQRILGSLVSRAHYGAERIPISKHGRVVAAIVSADDLEKLSAIREQVAA